MHLACQVLSARRLREAGLRSHSWGASVEPIDPARHGTALHKKVAMKKAPKGALLARCEGAGDAAPLKPDQKVCLTPTAMARPPLFSVTFSVLKAA